MIIGPFWCEEEKNWLRFVGEQNQLHVERARPGESGSSTKTEWQSDESLSKDFWIIDYTHGNTTPYTAGLRLLEGKLYYTNFKQNIAKDIPVSLYNAEGKLIIFNTNRSKLDPFSGQSLPNDREITPYRELPITPEDYQKQIEAHHEHVRQLEEEKLQKWNAWKALNVRAKLDLTQFSNHGDIVNRDLFESIDREMPALNPQDLSFEEYVGALEEALYDPSSDLNEKIYEIAATTHIDREQGLNPDNSQDVRNNLYRWKQEFIFGVLKAERDHLLNEYGIDARDDRLVQIKSIVRSQAVARPEVGHYDLDGSEEAIPEAGDENDQDLQRAIELSMAQPHGNNVVHTPVDNDAEENDADYQTAIQASLDQQQPVRSPTVQQRSVVLSQPENTIQDQRNLENQSPPLIHQPPCMDQRPQSDLDKIKIAVSTAVDNYRKWYEKEDLRGQNGLFSRLRHGKAGQQRAQVLKNKIIYSETKQDAIDYINTLLTDSHTRYHRHSFASFLLDELTKLEDQPWQDIVMDAKSNRYNRDSILEKFPKTDQNQLS